MKQLNILFTTICLIATISIINAQERYLEPVFDDVNVTIADVDAGVNIYGVNATILPLPVTGQAISEPLVFDFYEPVGDTLTERPLVLLFHTGNFLPQTLNGSVYGTRGDSSGVEIATRLAKMGYVVASVDYRLGWNPTAETQPERALGLIQAAYRGVQDARTAIRFFKRDHAEGGNTYGIDTSRITLWGVGTGGYVTLGATYLNTYLEIITTTNPTGKFVLEGGIPMVIESVNGDIEGTSFGVVPETGIPPFPPNDTLCIPNHIGYSSEFQLSVNMAGALGDPSWLNVMADPTDNIPIIAFHSPNDPFAPYIEDVLVVPTTGDRIVNVVGSQAVVESAVSQGVNDVFVDADIDDPYTQRAMAASAEAGHEYFEGLFPFALDLLEVPSTDGGVDTVRQSDPWQWWDTELWSMVEAVPGTGITFDQVARSGSPLAGPDRARMYIDTIIGYFAPRAYAALALDPAIVNTETQLSQTEVGLSLAPNPANQFINIQTNSDFPILDIEVYDLQGRRVRAVNNIQQNSFRLDRNGLSSGLYVTKLRFREGILTQKIIFD